MQMRSNAMCSAFVETEEHENSNKTLGSLLLTNGNWIILGGEWKLHLRGIHGSLIGFDLGKMSSDKQANRRNAGKRAKRRWREIDFHNFTLWWLYTEFSAHWLDSSGLQLPVFSCSHSHIVRVWFLLCLFLELDFRELICGWLCGYNCNREDLSWVRRSVLLVIANSALIGTKEVPVARMNFWIFRKFMQNTFHKTSSDSFTSAQANNNNNFVYFREGYAHLQILYSMRSASAMKRKRTEIKSKLMCGWPVTSRRQLLSLAADDRPHDLRVPNARTNQVNSHILSAVQCNHKRVTERTWLKNLHAKGIVTSYH